MKRGEVWYVNLDPTLGAEIKKTRPAVIVSRDEIGRLPLRVIVPLTAWQDKFSQADWHVKIEASRSSGLEKTSSADALQVRSISTARLVNKIGELDRAQMQRIAQALRVVLNLD